MRWCTSFSARASMLAFIASSCSSDVRLVGRIGEVDGGLGFRAFSNSDCSRVPTEGTSLAMPVDADGQFGLVLSRRNGSPSCVALESGHARVAFAIPATNVQLERLDEWLSLRLVSSTVSEGDVLHLYTHPFISIEGLPRPGLQIDSLALFALGKSGEAQWIDRRFQNGSTFELGLVSQPVRFRLELEGRARCGDVDCAVFAWASSDVQPVPARVPTRLCPVDDGCGGVVVSSADERLVALDAPDFVRLLILTARSPLDGLRVQSRSVQGAWKVVTGPQSVGNGAFVVPVYSVDRLTHFRLGGVSSGVELEVASVK